MTRPILIASILFIAACGEKEATTTSAADEAGATAPSSTLVPDDKASQKFGEKLFSTSLEGYKPIDSGGAAFKYSSFTFTPDGSWAATGAVTIQDESMECKELGTWTMDAAESADVAGMTWNLTKTNCAGREAPLEQRVKLHLLGNGQYKVDMR